MTALLLSLASCTGMDIISILRKKQQRVTAFHINIKAEQAEQYPKRFLRIELECVVRGYDVAPNAVARSIELSQTKYCGAVASLKPEIVFTYRIEEEDI
jgi:putative redox protein